MDPTKGTQFEYFFYSRFVQMLADYQSSRICGGHNNILSLHVTIGRNDVLREGGSFKVEDEELSFGHKILNGGMMTIVMIVLISAPLAGLMKASGTFDRLEAVIKEEIGYQNSLELEENKKLEKDQAGQDKLAQELVKKASVELESQLIINPQILTGERNIIFGDGEVSSHENKAYQKFESTMEDFVATEKSKNGQELLKNTQIALNVLDGEYSVTA